jgi:hypothetical protein
MVNPPKLESATKEHQIGPDPPCCRPSSRWYHWQTRQHRLEPDRVSARPQSRQRLEQGLPILASQMFLTARTKLDASALQRLHLLSKNFIRGREPTPRSVRIFSMQDSSVASAGSGVGGGSGSRRCVIDHMVRVSIVDVHFPFSFFLPLRSCIWSWFPEVSRPHFSLPS